MITAIRICDLSVRDVFILNGIQREVMRIKDGRLWYRSAGDCRKTNQHISAKSQQKVEVIVKENPVATEG